MPRTQKTRAHTGSELPSSRLASLACYAVAGRFATVLANICHHRFPGFHFLFSCHTGVPFADAHSTACLTSVAPTGLQVRRACARKKNYMLARARKNAPPTGLLNCKNSERKRAEFEAPKGEFSCEPERANVHVSDSERSREGAQAPSVRVSVSERSREP